MTRLQHMVAGRISAFNNALMVSSFPPAFDFTSDITSIDKATTFMRQVDSAQTVRVMLSSSSCETVALKP